MTEFAKGKLKTQRNRLMNQVYLAAFILSQALVFEKAILKII